MCRAFFRSSALKLAEWVVSQNPFCSLPSFVGFYLLTIPSFWPLLRAPGKMLEAPAGENASSRQKTTVEGDGQNVSGAGENINARSRKKIRVVCSGLASSKCHQMLTQLVQVLCSHTCKGPRPCAVHRKRSYISLMFMKHIRRICEYSSSK